MTRALGIGVAVAMLVSPATAFGRACFSFGESYGVILDPICSPVTYGETARVTGVVPPPNNSGLRVGLAMQSTPTSGDARPVGSIVYTDANGRFSFTFVPRVNGSYQARAWRGEEMFHSQIISQKVRFKVSTHVSDATPRAGQEVRFWGSVLPFSEFALRDFPRVRVQRRTRSGSYATIATSHTVSLGLTGTHAGYSLRARIRRTAYYRVRVSGDVEHASGWGKRRRLRVH